MRPNIDVVCATKKTFFKTQGRFFALRRQMTEKRPLVLKNTGSQLFFIDSRIIYTIVRYGVQILTSFVMLAFINISSVKYWFLYNSTLIHIAQWYK
jgi:hypothetical protein